ncbi:MAG: alkaline phosphatase [Marinifilaceae bacterium]
MRNKLKKSGILLLAVLFLGVHNIYAQTNAAEKARSNYRGPYPKYIFYFIGDGFGLAQTNAAETYLAAVSDKEGIQKLEMSKLPHQGFFTTYALNRFITGSAAAGTALATGHKTTINTIGMDGAKQNPHKSVAEMARDKGWKVGVVTSVSIDHATPAAFYAHQPSRNMYYNISLDLSKSNFNYFGGGGFNHPEGDGEINEKDIMSNIGMGGSDNDKNGKPNSIDIAKKRGYQYIDTKKGFKNLKAGDNKIIAVSPVLSGGKSLRYSIDQDENDISLAQFTAKGIELLDNSKGFFMMVEGGKIDWACHANDAATVIKETLDYDAAVAEALKFYNKHPKETLIVVAADHETGGMGMGFSGSHYQTEFQLLQHQNISYEAFSNLVNEYRKSHKETAKFEDIRNLVQKHFGLGDESKDLALSEFEVKRLKDAFEQSMLAKKERNKNDQYYLLYGSYDPITVTACHLLANKAGIGWTSYSHTATPIPMRAIGPGAELFSGYYDNTDLPKNIMKLLKVKK